MVWRIFRFSGRKGAWIMMPAPTPREGDLYKTITIAGHSFELRYGYYEDHERSLCPPVVIFPDLVSHPRFCPHGQPLVTQIQDPCEHYTTASGGEENWCGDCAHFCSDHREIGICTQPEKRRK